jgi:sulfate adenylyltransferase subunit 1
MAHPTDTASSADTHSALRFITCGSVDDGKSTLIGRLLVDSRAVLQDQWANVSHSGTADLALFTDGLSAEREQGITIDVAYRYFATPKRKFIIGDAPGHEQYTRNMVTAASSAHAAVVLVDATKLQWEGDALPALLPQTRRHALLVHLLRVPHLIFAINKLDALERADAPVPAAAQGAHHSGASDRAGQAFQKISAALHTFAQAAGIAVHATVPMSALLGHNVVSPRPGWCGYHGPSVLQLLEELPVVGEPTGATLALPVQWVEKFHDSSDTQKGRRVFWGRVAQGRVQVGQQVAILPSGQTAVVAQVLNHVRAIGAVDAGQSAGVVLDREVDVSRGDWLLASDAGAQPLEPTRTAQGTVAWMDDEPLVAGRTYWALHGHRWIKAKVTQIAHGLDIHTLATHAASTLAPNAIGTISLALQEPIPVQAYNTSRVMGALILVDTASHKTSGALMLS